MAEYTGNVDGLGTLRLLDALRTAGLGDSVRFYQASTRCVHVTLDLQRAEVVGCGL